jgi:hypothetical protein
VPDPSAAAAPEPSGGIGADPKDVKSRPFGGKVDDAERRTRARATDSNVKAQKSSKRAESEPPALANAARPTPPKPVVHLFNPPPPSEVAAAAPDRSGGIGADSTDVKSRPFGGQVDDAEQPARARVTDSNVNAQKPPERVESRSRRVPNAASPPQPTVVPFPADRPPPSEVAAAAPDRSGGIGADPTDVKSRPFGGQVDDADRRTRARVTDSNVKAQKSSERAESVQPPVVDRRPPVPNIRPLPNAQPSAAGPGPGPGGAPVAVPVQAALPSAAPDRKRAESAQPTAEVVVVFEGHRGTFTVPRSGTIADLRHLVGERIQADQFEFFADGVRVGPETSIAQVRGELECQRTGRGRTYAFVLKDRTETITVPDDHSVADAKRAVAQHFRVDPDLVTLMYGGEQLQDKAIVARLRIPKDGKFTVHVRDLGAILLAPQVPKSKPQNFAELVRTLMNESHHSRAECERCLMVCQYDIELARSTLMNTTIDEDSGE